MKRTIAFLTVMMMMVAMVNGCGRFGEGGQRAHAVNYRNGIGLTPVSEDSTGVALKSDFLITFEEGFEQTFEEVDGQVTIEPAVSYQMRTSDEGILLSLDEAMAADTIYRFTLHGTVWTYQTQKDFAVVGTLPRNHSTNVPLDSGIEMYFTHEGAEAEDYFEIEPRVNGRFEQYGNAVVFVSTGLMAETMYTVTLKEGLSLKGAESTLSDSYSFSFETLSEKDSRPEPKGYFSYNKMLNDLSTAEKAVLPFEYSIYSDDTDAGIIETAVYELNSHNHMAGLMEDYMTGPTWRYYGEQPETEIRGLDKVVDFEQPIADRYGYEGAMEIPVDLEKGVYLVKSRWEDVMFQTFLQVSDLGYYYFSDDENDYYWVHDLQTKSKADQAEADGEKADADGVIKLLKNTEKGFGYTVIQNGGDRVMHFQFNDDFSAAADQYWKFFMTDRAAYKSEDRVKFFGFLKERTTGETPEQITVELKDQPRYFEWFWPGSEQNVPLEKFVIEANNGFYEGDIDLPKLDEGGYNLELKVDGQVVVSHYIQVENYVKPDYLLTIDKDKEAIFLDETVNYTIKTAFFEGTPVPGLDLNYEIYGLSYNSGALVTDEQGEGVVAYTPTSAGGRQGIQYDGISAYAVLPESGEIYENNQVRVFVNDIDVQIETELEEEKGMARIQVNSITLDRLNDGTAEDSEDYLDRPVAGQVLDGTIYRNEWLKEASGERYDFINKKVVTTYTYRKDTQVLSTFQVDTDASGVAKFDVHLPEEKDVYYTLEMTTKDQKGHFMKFERSFYEYAPYRYDGEGFMMMEADREAYHVGEEAQIAILRNNEAVRGEEFLFVLGTEGVQSTQWRNEGHLTLSFEESYVPGVEVVGVVFTGTGYETADRTYLPVDMEDYELDLSIKTNKASFKPGDMAVIKVKASWKDKSREASLADTVVNLNMVDESYLALFDQMTDPLTSLYRRRNTGMTGFYGSHNNQHSSWRYYGNAVYTMANEAYAMDIQPGSAMKMEAAREMATSGGTVVRKDFKDTALFVNIDLNSDGNGVFEFRLPDNVTSWRLTGAAVSSSLGAGSEVKSVDVSLPFFISPTLNSTYLAGDRPFIGLSAYGTEMDDSSNVRYTVTCEETGYQTEGSAGAFERLNLPLFELEEGIYHIQVTAVSEGGFKDGYEEVIEVVDTYQEHRTVDSYMAEEAMTLPAGEGGMTTLTFTDRTKGIYLPLWYRLSYAGGKRVDQAYLGSLASEVLNEKFDVKSEMKEVLLSDYLTVDGGIALLPYSESDLMATAKLAGLIEDSSTQARVKSYLYSQYYNRHQSNKALILYGLASMGESVLIDLNRMIMVDNLSKEDRLYLAMAYGVSGDVYMAQLIYDNYFADDMEIFDQRAKYSKGSQEDMFKISSELLPLLALFDPGLAEKVYDFVGGSYSDVYLPNLDLYLYAKTMMAYAGTGVPRLVYIYDGAIYEADFGRAWGGSVELPSSKLDSFQVDTVEGDVMIVTEYSQSGSQTGDRDDSVKVTRTFVDPKTDQEKNSFETGEMVKVVLDWEISENAIENGYQITDYAPSGLIPLSNPMQYDLDGGWFWFNDVEGQKVSFGVYKGMKQYRPMVYYARVVSPGTFKADPAMIQGFSIKDSYNLSEPAEVIIAP